METFKCIANRHSTRKFTKGTVTRAQLQKIIGAGRKAPRAGGIWNVRCVGTLIPRKIENLAMTTLQPEVFENVGAVIAVFSNPTQLVERYGMRGLTFSIQNAAAAVQNMLLAATDMGLASLWIGVFDSDKVREVMHSPSHFVDAIVLIGYEK